jgi:hypothetical protein
MKHSYPTYHKPNYLLRIVLITALITYIIVYVSANGGIQMSGNMQTSGAEE